MLRQAANRETTTLRGTQKALAELASGAPLVQVLTTLARSAEEAFPEMRCSILLIEEERLRLGAAPNLPAFYNAAIEGYPIGPSSGSCGTAAYLGERVVVEDIRTDPKWEIARAVAERAKLRACWSEPVLGPDGTVIGTFAMYYGEPRAPSVDELEFIETRARLAGIAITIERTQRQLRTNEERFRQLAENITEVFWLTDWRTNTVLYVSPAYAKIWGRSCESLYEDPSSWAKAIVDEDREGVVTAFRDCALGTYDVEYRIERPDGTRRWIHDRAFPIADEDGEVYRVAGLSADVTETKHVEEALRAARDELARRSGERIASLTSELLLAEETERRRLAVELHDGPNQDLALASMKLSALRRSGDCEAAGVEDVAVLIERANRAARSLTFQLSPPILHDLGFEAAVQWLAEDVERDYGVRVQVDVPAEPLPLGERVRVMLFRAVRELLINVAKHAQAESARVEVSEDGGFARIVVADDGVAFEPEETGQRGLGLSTIEERLSHLGGSMKIESRSGRGTRVYLLAPFDPAERERDRRR